MICYGENEAYAGEAGLADFRSGLNALLDALKPTGARVLLLGPRKHEKLGPPLPDPAPYNANLKKYTEVIAAVAKERGHAFIDLYDLPGKTENGLHLTEAGEQEFVEALLAQARRAHRRLLRPASWPRSARPSARRTSSSSTATARRTKRTCSSSASTSKGTTPSRSRSSTR